MARNLEWRELKVGGIAFAVLISLAVSILLFARVGALHGDTSNIYVLTDDAPGVLNGTEVWLSGEKIGAVKDVHFRPITTDTLRRLAIHTEVFTGRLHFIRKDAYADIRPGGNLIGSPIVFISSGTSNAPPLRNGDTLITQSTGKMKPLSNRVGDLGPRVNALADSGKRALALLNSQMAGLAKLGRTGVPPLVAAGTEASKLVGKATRGEGSIGLVIRGNVRERLRRITASKDSITMLLSSEKGNIGRFRKDSTLATTVGRIRSQLDSLRTGYSTVGGITRMRSDTALAAEMTRMRTELTALMADLKKRPRRYISF
ncbi:MAG: MlaD family protein [Gemmatimonadales bacterium]